MKKFLFLSLLFSLKPFNLFSIHFCLPGDTLNVLAQSGLRLRQTPENGAIIITIPYGEKIIVDTNPQNLLEAKSVIDGIKGRWTRVWYMGKVGYVFDGFLSSLPPPTPDCKSIELYLKKQFRQAGPAIVHRTAYDDGDTFSYSNDSLFTYIHSSRWNQIVTCKATPFYEGHESLTTFYDVSIEEVWQIVRLCYQGEFQEILSHKAPDDDRDFRPFTTFTPNKPDGSIFINFSNIMYSEITIRAIQGAVVVEHSDSI